MTEDELDALIMLAHLGEPGDQVLGSYVRKRGPVAAVQAIKARKSGLRDGAGLYARLRLADPAAARENAGASVRKLSPEGQLTGQHNLMI